MVAALTSCQVPVMTTRAITADIGMIEPRLSPV